MYEPTRGGTRGGQAEFKWSEVSADKDRENYLGHSINAPTGRWQKNKDVHWYNRDVTMSAEEKEEELRCIREAENEALAVALGFQPSKPAAGAVPATGSNAVPATARGGPSQPSAGPNNGYAKALAAASALYSDDENLDLDVALRRKEREEKRRQKAEKKAAKEEKKRIGEEERERRAMEYVGRERERLHERKGKKGDRRGWDGREGDGHKRRGERQLTPLEDRPWVEKRQPTSRSRSPLPRRPRSLDRERRSARDEPYDEAAMARERERDRRRWEESSRRRDSIDYSRR